MQNSKITSAHYSGSLDNHDPLDVTIDKKKQQQPCLQDRIKLVYVDDEYSGLTQGICGTVSGIYAANEICKSVNRPELIIWVKWDNGIELGLIEGIDKYEIIVSDVTTNNIAQAAEQTVNSIDSYEQST
jgi:hypothetical protein